MATEKRIFSPYWKVIQEKLNEFRIKQEHYTSLLETVWRQQELDDETRDRYLAIVNNYTHAIQLLEAIQPKLSHFVFSIELANDELGASHSTRLENAKMVADTFKTFLESLDPNAGMSRQLVDLTISTANALRLLVIDITELAERKGKIGKAKRIASALIGVGSTLLALVMSMLKIAIYPISKPIEYTESGWHESEGDYSENGRYIVSDLLLHAFDSFKAALRGQEEPPAMKELERELGKLQHELNAHPHRYNDQPTEGDPQPIADVTPLHKDLSQTSFWRGCLNFESVQCLRKLHKSTITALELKVSRERNKFFQANESGATTNDTTVPTKESLKIYKNALYRLDDIDYKLYDLVVAVKAAQKEMLIPYPEGLNQTIAVMNQFNTILKNPGQDISWYYDKIDALTKEFSSALILLTDDINHLSKDMNRSQQAISALYGVACALLSFVVAILTVVLAPIWAHPDAYERSRKGKYVAKDLFLEAFDSLKAAWTGRKNPPKMKQLERELALFNQTLQQTLSLPVKEAKPLGDDSLQKGPGIPK